MTHEAFESWLDAYGRAWQTRDPEAAAALFTEDATYQETPFAEPMRGRAAILEYWSHVRRSQEQIRFSYEILTTSGSLGIARWWSSFVRIPSKETVKLDGIFVLTFSANNLCQKLREWWQRQEYKTVTGDE